MFNMTKVKVELITDPGMYIFFKIRMTGRFSYISISYSKANNKYLKYYNQKQE